MTTRVAADAATVPWSIPGCDATPVGRALVDGMVEQQWTLSCETVDRLVLERPDPRVILVRNGDRQTVLGVGDTEVSLAEASWQSFGWLGVEHLLTGLDHVLLVLGLTALLRPRQLLVAVTAFTVGHALTLWLAAGGVGLPMALVECGIAASLVWLAVELLHDGVIAKWPGMMPLGIGMVHGLGFASALAELSVPAGARVWALLAFNVGLEVAQLACVAAGLLLLGRVPTSVVGWGIGLVGATLFWERFGAWIGL